MGGCGKRNGGSGRRKGDKKKWDGNTADVFLLLCIISQHRHKNTNNINIAALGTLLSLTNTYIHKKK